MEQLSCAHCGEIIGVYEPIRLLLPDASERHGSLLKLEAELGAPGVIAVHEHCYEQFMQAREQGGVERRSWSGGRRRMFCVRCKPPGAAARPWRS